MRTRRLKAGGRKKADAVWLDRQAPSLIVNQFSLAPLEPLVRSEVLFALAARDCRGSGWTRPQSAIALSQADGGRACIDPAPTARSISNDQRSQQTRDGYAPT
uniref:hypothetical protein n=1 Tax=Nonomuraea sp. CA-252377 TaxID=3240003 RepID=UPI003F4962D6